MAQLQNPFDNAPDSAFLPLAKVDAINGRLICSAPGGGGKRQWTEVPLDTRIIINHGAVMAGLISFKPLLKKIVVPINLPMPEVPNDGRTWQSVIEVPILIEGLGLYMLSITGPLAEDKNSINQNRIIGPHARFKRAPQAQLGQLCEYLLHGFEPVSSAEFGIFQAIILQLTGVWFDYNEELFGPRLLPPPSPLLGGPAPQQQLPQPRNDNGGTPLSPPANDHVPTPVAAPAPTPTPPPPTPTPAETPPPPAATNDPFSRYRPAGAGRKPY